MRREQRVEYAQRLREARATVRRNAERYVDIIVIVEEIGKTLYTQRQKKGMPKGLGQCREIIRTELFPETNEWSGEKEGSELTVEQLFEHVRKGRNSGAHEGATSRVTGKYTEKLAMAVEGALMKKGRGRPHGTVKEWMVENPVEAKAWHTVGQARTAMLRHGFDALPVWTEWKEENEREWGWVTTEAVVNYLCNEGNVWDDIGEAAESGGMRIHIAAPPADPGTPIEIATMHTEWPDSIGWLVTRSEKPEELIGILTAHDLLLAVG